MMAMTTNSSMSVKARWRQVRVPEAGADGKNQHFVRPGLTQEVSVSWR